MNNPAIIRMSNLRRHYRMGQETVKALDGVDITVAAGEYLGVTGPSGSGKSTLLYLLGGLDRPTAGDIWVRDQNIAQLDEDALALYRRRTVGFVFQMFNLIPSMTALQNVEFPMRFARVSTAERRKRAANLLGQVGLGDRLAHRPNELSGGQQQRCAIARALVNDPAILLADEPTGNLDSRAGAEILGLFQRLNEQGITVVMVSHDPAVMEQAGRSIRLHDGRLALS